MRRARTSCESRMREICMSGLTRGRERAVIGFCLSSRAPLSTLPSLRFKCLFGCGCAALGPLRMRCRAVHSRMLNGRRAILLLRVVMAGPCRKSIESRANSSKIFAAKNAEDFSADLGNDPPFSKVRRERKGEKAPIRFLPGRIQFSGADPTGAYLTIVLTANGRE